MNNIIEYLTLLEANNNREWYHANKSLKAEADEEFYKLLGDMITKIATFDESVINNVPKELTFKLVRDTRFSKDKSPYNPSFRAHISSKGKLPVPVGYFIYIMPNDRSFLGGGLFADVFKDATKMIREYISENGEEFKKILNNENFKKYFELKGSKLKKVPTEYENNKWGEYLKYKSWFIEYNIKDKELNKDFVSEATDIFKAMKPFNDFLNKALRDFVMPTR